MLLLLLVNCITYARLFRWQKDPNWKPIRRAMIITALSLDSKAPTLDARESQL